MVHMPKISRKNKHVTKERGNKYEKVGRLQVQKVESMVKEPGGDGGHGTKVVCTPGGMVQVMGGYEHRHGHNIINVAGMHGHGRQRKGKKKECQILLP
jgi:hypothetical protein